ncbi:hypothetical protein [Amnibacterium endophyticum]|uniref:Uncharacterized protein n=1 Tax=Amnibacterium endophyticum TaxID=2109337 RepID=A0ABW4LA94_9MICO
MLSIGGPVWGVAVLLMLATLLVLNLVRLRRSGDGRPSWVPTVSVVLGVLVVIGLVLAFGAPPD